MIRRAIFTIALIGAAPSVMGQTFTPVQIGVAIPPYNSSHTSSPRPQTTSERFDRSILATDDSGVDPTGVTGSGAGFNRLLGSHYLTANTTSGSPVLTGVSSTEGLAAGQRISGYGLPLSATTIISVDSPSQITVSQNATATTTGQAFGATVAGNAGTRLHIPCGTYNLDFPVLLPSNTLVSGDGDCTHIAVSTTLAKNPYGKIINPLDSSSRVAFTNGDWSGGDSNVRVSNLFVDASAGLSAGNFFAFWTYNVDGLTADNMRVVTWTGGEVGANGVNFTKTHNVNIHDNYVWGASGNGACYDGWGGVYDFRIINNYCYGGAAKDYGIQINGVDTDGTPNSSHHGVIADNVIDSIDSASIDIFGLTNGGGSYVHDVTVANNSVRNTAGATTGVGMRIGQAYSISAIGNMIDGIAGFPYAIKGVSAADTTRDITISGGSIINSCTAGGVSGAISIGNSSDAPENVSIGPMTVNSPMCLFAYDVRSGALNTSLYAEGIVKGSTGYISDAGSGTVFVGGQRTARVGSTAFAKTSDTSLADVTGLTINVKAGLIYKISGVLTETQAAAGGQKYSLGGTATATWVSMPISIQCSTPGAAPQNTAGVLTAIGAGTVSEVATGCMASTVRIDGQLLAATDGTITIKFAQQVSDATPSSIGARSFIQATAVY